ncbi:MAG TPA: hypothetical protein VIW92_09790, partial [Thermoanaerobaculia bacterium]
GDQQPRGDQRPQRGDQQPRARSRQKDGRRRVPAGMEPVNLTPEPPTHETAEQRAIRIASAFNPSRFNRFRR